MEKWNMQIPEDPPVDETPNKKGRAEEDEHLARDHGLKRVIAYVPDPNQAKAKNGAAVRKERQRAREAAQGLTQAKVPKQIAEAIKEKGGFEPWLADHVEERLAKRRATEPPQLSDRYRRLIQIGHRVEALTGFPRWAVLKLLRLRGDFGVSK